MLARLGMSKTLHNLPFLRFFAFSLSEKTVFQGKMKKR
jgi:hypothetical protein